MSYLYEHIIKYYKTTIGQFKEGEKEYINFLNKEFKQFESLNIIDIWNVYGYKYNDKEFYNDKLNINDKTFNTDKLIKLFDKTRSIKKYTTLKVSKLKTYVINLFYLTKLHSEYCVPKVDIYEIFLNYYKENVGKDSKPTNEFMDLYIKEKYTELPKNHEHYCDLKQDIEKRTNPYLDDLVEFYLFDNHSFYTYDTFTEMMMNYFYDNYYKNFVVLNQYIEDEINQYCCLTRLDKYDIYNSISYEQRKQMIIDKIKNNKSEIDDLIYWYKRILKKI